MAGGTNALAGAAGFARGFTNALLEGQKTAREERHRKEDQKLKEFSTVFPLIWDEAQSSGDYSRANEIVGEYMPDIGKSMKQKGVDLKTFGSIAPVLAPAAKPAAAQARSTSQTFTDLSTPQMEAGGPPVLESRPAVAPGTPPAPPDQKSVFLGMPMTTPTQKIQSRTAAARRFSQANPDVPLMSSFKMFGLDVPNVSATSQGSVQSVAGEMPDGSPAFGILDRRPNSPTFGKYLDADTQEPLLNFQPRTSTGSRSLGADREAKAKEMFGKSASQLTSEQMAQVNAALPAFAGTMAEARGAGTGRAKIQTELDSPIGTTAAQIYNVAPTTTMRQLQGTIALRPDQQEQIRSLGQVDALLTEIGNDLPKVFPEVAPGIWGRLQTQFSLGAQKLGADEDLAELDAAISAALAQVAQLSGQPGSRLSDTDLRLAHATLAEITPKVFGGDTLATAKMRLGVVQRLLEKAKGGVVHTPATLTPAGAPGATTPPPAPGAPAPSPAAAPGAAPGAGAAAAAAPGKSTTGLKMDAQGNLKDAQGNIIIPAQ